MPTPWLDEEERQAWLRLIAVVELLPGALDGQLRRDAGLTHFEYFVLAMVSEEPDRTLPMARLARRTNATLPRLSHVVRRLEDRGLIERVAAPDDGRVTLARLTDAGWACIVDAAPGHVTTVREAVFAGLSRRQVAQLTDIAGAMLDRLDPEGRMTGHSAPPVGGSTAAAETNR